MARERETFPTADDFWPAGDGHPFGGGSPEGGGPVPAPADKEGDDDLDD